MDIKDFESMEAYEKHVERNRRIASFKRNFSGWLIMIPSLILFVFFVWWPLVSSIRLSLFTARGMEIQNFVGFYNYFTVMELPEFWPAVWNTFKYTGWSLLIGFLLPIVVALVMSELVQHGEVEERTHDAGAAFFGCFFMVMLLAGGGF